MGKRISFGGAWGTTTGDDEVAVELGDRGSVSGPGEMG